MCLVADVIKSFDTVDRPILECAPDRLGLPHKEKGQGPILFHAGSAVALMVMVIFSGHVLIEIRENPDVHDLEVMDTQSWPRCLLWHGWLPLLSGVKMVALLGRKMLLRVLPNLLECAFGPYSSSLLTQWRVPD